MSVLDVIKKLEQSTEFTSWKKSYEKAYLVHCFRMNDAANINTWQIGYFNPETHLISVFNVNDKIVKSQDAEVFKEQEKLVYPLDLSRVKILEDEAMKKSEEVLHQEYKGI